MSDGRSESAQIFEHDLGVCAGVAHFVDPSDGAVGIDQKRDAFRIVRVVFIGTALNPVRVADDAVHIRQQAVAELFVRREDLVVLGSVERSAEDRGTEFVEL
jgi:hypothetical protein